MKKLFILVCSLLAVVLNAQITTAPAILEANQAATLTFNKTGTPLATYTGVIYAYIGVTVNGVRFSNIKGSPVFNNTAAHPALTQVGSTSSYTLNITPDLYTYFGVLPSNSITEICLVLKSADASIQTSPDIFIPVGAFQYNLVTPSLNSASIIASGSNVAISANNTNGTAAYELKANGQVIHTATTAVYSYSDNNVQINKSYELKITQGVTSFVAKFAIIVNPGSTTAVMPAGLIDGINYNPADPTKATLVINAPNKDFVYVAGSFNNWLPNASFAMTRDSSSPSGSRRFFLELTGLTAGQIYAYQYWIGDQTGLPANSPALVKTADPFSTLVLSPFDDPEIIQLGVFPNLPVYNTIAAGQEREVSVLQTGNNGLFAYNWSAATTNFVKPKKKDLVFYELLVRDFDSNRSFQDLINKIDYFKNLKINAIKIMPVMEFEGNLSWGYNTVYHLALDKRYGPPAKLKEFIDLCHQNGIAVVLDIALNHVFGRSPLERMYMLDTDGDGWANTSTTGVRTTLENPYVNENAQHSYNVGSDLNHFRISGPGANMTRTYAQRAIQHWIQEYKIDGYRWDLTKGFTNSCPPGSNQESCTNGYQADRVAKMKEYADIQWTADPSSLIIFEHLGTGGSYNEEVEWANYNRAGNVGGIMQWRKMTDPYANLIKGQATNLSGVADATDRFVGYAESHDEERVVYKALTEAGQTQNNLPKVLQRLPAMGSVLFLVPGPKMLWHFGELGWDKSLWTCNNNNVSFSNPDCKLDTKPQPQWAWSADVARQNVYNNWAKQIALRIAEPVFENGQYAFNNSITGQMRLDVYTSTAQTTSLSYVFVLTNFSDNTINVPGNFPFTGTWSNLMDNTNVVVTANTQNVTIEPGGYRVYGNVASLSTSNFDSNFKLALYPNPVSDAFKINTELNALKIYSTTGQLVKSFGKLNADTNVNVADLQNGIYFVKAIDTNGNNGNAKFIKQ